MGVAIYVRFRKRIVFKGALQMSRFTLRVSMRLERDRNLLV